VKDYLYDERAAYDLISILRNYYKSSTRAPKFWIEKDERGLLSIRSNISFQPLQNN
jgi:hypothetical protein